MHYYRRTGIKDWAGRCALDQEKLPLARVLRGRVPCKIRSQMSCFARTHGDGTDTKKHTPMFSLTFFLHGHSQGAQTYQSLTPAR